jgi:predicted alpha/beta-fold hydrolase
MSKSKYVEYHQKMLNKQVLVVDKEYGDWVGYVKEANGSTTFIVQRLSDNETMEVDMFDIRSL